MPTASASHRLRHAVLRAAVLLSLVAAFVGLGLSSTENAVANGDTRTLSFYHLHTGEHLTVTFKVDGRYDSAALAKLDWFMRDWRKGRATHMDPRLYDLLWEVHRATGAVAPIYVVCGYRSPGTNAMLRGRSSRSGVARFSQHMLGHAIDFFIPGVPLEKLREAGLREERGGVGYYPTSGSPFVHMDVGNIRMWPRMSRAELSRVFPDGRTTYLPADGHPLAGYQLALADIRARGATVHAQFDFADAGKHEIATPAQAASSRQPSLLASLFGGARPEVAGAASATTAAVPAKPAPAAPPRPQLAALAPATTPVAAPLTVPLPRNRPAMLLASATPMAPPTVADAAAAAKRKLAAGLLALAAHMPVRRSADDDPAITGSVSAFANSDRGLDAMLRSGKPGGVTLATASLGAPPLPNWRRAMAERTSGTIRRRIDDAFTDPIAALIARTDAAAALVSHPLDAAALDAALAAHRLADDASHGLVHPEQIHIAALLALPARVNAAGFSTAPVSIGPGHFTGAAVAIMPTRGFADAASLTRDEPRG
ncbi:MAG TPA: DUF882 domain-containing protein [Hyphomicrobiales bacterium]|nr:DUF882 domain-containing protein [Hyphomicrobiales bacterium]